MQKIKISLFIIIILIGLFFLFVPEARPENFQFKNLLSSAPKEKVIIVFNSGGWGNTPPEASPDFKPIVDGIEKSLQDMGYESIVVPYERTKTGLVGQVTGLKRILGSFDAQAEIFARDLEVFLEKNPGKKIIMAGLCGGAEFSDKVMERISQQKKNSVFAIEIGTPFWEQPGASENILHIDNNEDALAQGRIMPLISVFLKGSKDWFLKRISGEKAVYGRVIHLDGHDYFWPELEHKIVPFLATSMNK